MKYIGLDLGSRTLGVAISDEMGILARAYDTLRFRDDDYEKAIEYTIDICKKEKVSTVVLGLPKHMNNSEGIRVESTMEFKEKLERRLGLEVVMWDERLTTVAADRTMMEAGIRRENRKEYVDMLAAQFILQGYLDSLAFKKKQEQEN